MPPASPLRGQEPWYRGGRHRASEQVPLTFVAPPGRQERGLLGRFGASPCWAAALPTVIVQEGSYATEAIGDCLDAFRGGFVLGVE